MLERHVAVLGCGVIGLSTAIAILEDEVSSSSTHTTVTIVAKEHPPLSESGPSQTSQQSQLTKASAAYASAWAGGHHVSDAKNAQELLHDQVTFARMVRLAKERPWASTTTSSEFPAEPLVWVHQTEYFEAGSNAKGMPPYTGVLDWYPDFAPIANAALPDGIKAGCTFSTLDINVPVYLRWLLHRFLALGGRLIVRDVGSLADAIHASCDTSANAIGRSVSPQIMRRPDALIVSPGLGALTLTDVKDTAVHPQRGQVVVVHAPWLTVDPVLGKAQNARHSIPGYSIVRAQGGRETYIIPRGDGTVICGGTRIVNDWDTSSRLETTQQILTRCLKLAPGLADPKKINSLTTGTIADLDVVSVNVGLRPARTRGVRLEQGVDINGVKVIHNYGYGGWGYQASWGAAAQAKQLLHEALTVPGVETSKL